MALYKTLLANSIALVTFTVRDKLIGRTSSASSNTSGEVTASRDLREVCDLPVTVRGLTYVSSISLSCSSHSFFPYELVHATLVPVNTFH